MKFNHGLKRVKDLVVATRDESQNESNTKCKIKKKKKKFNTFFTHLNKKCEKVKIK